MGGSLFKCPGAGRFRARSCNPREFFFHRGRDLWCVVHGDDFVFAGTDADLDYALETLKANYEIKNRGRLGGDEGPAEKKKGVTVFARCDRRQQR